MSDERGTFLCGNIEVTCTELPKNVIACHCSDCQKASGGGPSLNIVIPDDKIQITKGKTSVLNVTADSGSPVERHFCSNCGAAVFSRLLTRTVCKAGLFNHVEDLALAANVWSSSASKLIRKLKLLKKAHRSSLPFYQHSSVMAGR